MLLFLAILQVVAFILWFVPSVAVLAPTFVFFLPTVIALALITFWVVVAFIAGIAIAASKRRYWR